MGSPYSDSNRRRPFTRQLCLRAGQLPCMLAVGVCCTHLVPAHGPDLPTCSLSCSLSCNARSPAPPARPPRPLGRSRCVLCRLSCPAHAREGPISCTLAVAVRIGTRMCTREACLSTCLGARSRPFVSCVLAGPQWFTHLPARPRWACIVCGVMSQPIAYSPAPSGLLTCPPASRPGCLSFSCPSPRPLPFGLFAGPHRAHFPACM